MKTFIALAVLSLVTSPLIADIETMRARVPKIVELKDKGVVGEKLDGFLGVIKPDGDAQEVVEAENSDRRAEYTKRATTQGQAMDVLAKVLGEARIRQEKAGRMIQDASSNWVKK